MYSVLLKKSAQKELQSLPKSAQNAIAKKLDDLAVLGTKASHTKKLQPPIGGHRTRVGTYRILFDIQEDILVVHKIAQRSRVY